MTKRIAHTTLNSTNLDRVMDEQGRRNDWLAQEMKVSVSLVTRWRNGQRRVEQYIPELARVLGVSPDEIR